MKYSSAIVFFVVVFPVCSSASAESDPKVVFFRDEVRPILRRCVACHSGGDPTGGLTLTTRDGALKGGDDGPALVPGDSAKSLLFHRTSVKEMPPKKPLNAVEIGVLRRWIEDGAVWEGVVAKEVQRAGRIGGRCKSSSGRNCPPLRTRNGCATQSTPSSWRRWRLAGYDRGRRPTRRTCCAALRST